MKIRKDFLIDDNLVGSACVSNGIDRAFGGGSNCRDADVHRIKSGAGALWEVPLRCAGGRRGTRLGETHHPTLRTACGDICPTFKRRFHKVCRAVIHDDARGRSRRISELISGWIDLRAGKNQRWICHPQRFRLIIYPRVCTTALPAIRVNGSPSRVADQQMQVRTR